MDSVRRSGIIVNAVGKVHKHIGYPNTVHDLGHRRLEPSITGVNSRHLHILWDLRTKPYLPRGDLEPRGVCHEGPLLQATGRAFLVRATIYT